MSDLGLDDLLSEDDSDQGDDLDSLFSEYDQAVGALESDVGDDGAPGNDLSSTPDDDLARLLAGYDGGQSGETHDPRLDEIYAWAQQQEHEKAIRADRVALAEAAETILEKLGNPNISQKMAESVLLREFVVNPVFRNRYAERLEDPKGWQNALARVERAWSEDLRAGEVDVSATADRMAVEAAIRGASSDAPPRETVDFRGMSDSDFEAYKRSLLRR